MIKNQKERHEMIILINMLFMFSLNLGPFHIIRKVRFDVSIFCR
jgi:hypothetical protein